MRFALFSILILPAVGLAQDSTRKCPDPPIVFPPLARQARIQGEVCAVVKVARDGRVESVEADGHPLLLRAVEFPVKQWSFARQREDGERDLIVRFELAFDEPCSYVDVTECWIENERVVRVRSRAACVMID